MIGLVDCNSFYASCEKLFRPDLHDRPVVVLSNNDGCIVSMSPEAKQEGIRRGDPYFRSRALLEKRSTAVFSSNYTLYQDISKRVMDALREIFPAVEVYSIDEAFVHISDAADGVEAFAEKAKQQVEQWVGVPVTIGFGRSKTLAKAANRWAKSHKLGIFVLREEEEENILKKIPVFDLWGIGPRKGKVLIREGLRTAWDLREASQYWIKRRFTIVTLRTLWELRGRPSVENEFEFRARQGILSSQGFSRPIVSLEELRQAAAGYAERAAEKLHCQGSAAGYVTVFLRTNHYRDLPQYANQSTVSLEPPTDYVPDIIAAAQRGLSRIFRSGYEYAKAGVYLSGIDMPESRTPLLFSGHEKRRKRLSRTVQEVKKRYGKRSIHTLRSAGSCEWSMRRDFLSPRYTTCWDELPETAEQPRGIPDEADHKQTD